MPFLASVAFAAVASLHLFWTGPEREAIRLTVEQSDSDLRYCAPSGLEVRYRYTFKLCKRRTGWFDRCDDERTAVRSFQFNPISEMYHITTDFLGDDDPPRTDFTSNIDEAFATVGSIPKVAATFISKRLTADLDLKRYYLLVRVVADCKGEMSQTVARISGVLSLGLVAPVRFDSGSVRFDLQPLTHPS